MLWKGLGLFFNTESPIVVVLRCAFDLAQADICLTGNPVGPWNLPFTAGTCSS